MDAFSWQLLHLPGANDVEDTIWEESVAGLFVSSGGDGENRRINSLSISVRDLACRLNGLQRPAEVDAGRPRLHIV